MKNHYLLGIPSWRSSDAQVQGQVQGQGQGPALLAASSKSPDVLARLLACGAAAATLPPASLIAWSRDALTQTALEQFDRDVAASLSLSFSPSLRA